MNRARKRNKKSLRQRHYRNLDYSKVLATNGHPIRAALVRHQLAIEGTARVLRFGGKVLLGVTRTAFGIVKFATRPLTRSLKRRLNRRLPLKKLLLTKYWMPNIHSNKWR